jgi:hypothetical protein
MFFPGAETRACAEYERTIWSQIRVAAEVYDLQLGAWKPKDRYNPGYRLVVK